MHDIRLRFVVQRVRAAQIMANGEDRGSFERGLVVYAGIGNPQPSASVKPNETGSVSFSQAMDTLKPSLGLAARKIIALRTFGKDNATDSIDIAVAEVGGSIALISQFTLWADCRKGNRPSFQAALEPVLAEKIYDALVQCFRAEAAQVNVPVITGIFGADMEVQAINYGPVTYVIDIVAGKVIEP